MTNETNRPVEIGQGDKQAAQDWFNEAADNHGHMTHSLELAFARHAASAREEALKEAAELAENWNPGREDRVTETSIADAIKALSIVGEGD